MGRRRERLRPRAGPVRGPIGFDDAGPSERLRRLRGPAAALVLILAVTLALVGTDADDDPGGGDRTADEGAAGPGTTDPDDEVTLPGDPDDAADVADTDTDGTDDGAFDDDALADADLDDRGFDDGDDARFECLVASGCGWRADVSDLGEEVLSVEAAGDDTLLISGTEAVAAFDHDGARRWTQPWGRAAEEVGGAVAAGPVVLTATNTRLVGWDADSGRRRWSASGPGDTPLHPGSQATPDGSTVLATYVGSGSGNGQELPSLVRAHSAVHGGPRWEAQADAVVLAGEVVVLIDEALTGLDAATGEELWRTAFDDLASSPDGRTAPLVDLTGTDRLLLHYPRDPEAELELLDVTTGEVTYATDGDEVVWAAGAGVGADATRIVVQLPNAASEFMGIDRDGHATWHRSGGLGDRCCELLPSPDVLAVNGGAEDHGATLIDPVDGGALFAGSHPEGVVQFALGRDIVVVAHRQSDTQVAIDLRQGRALWRSRELLYPQLDVPGYWLHRLDDEVVAIPTDPARRS